LGILSASRAYYDISTRFDKKLSLFFEIWSEKKPLAPQLAISQTSQNLLDTQLPMRGPPTLKTPKNLILGRRSAFQ